MPRFIVLCCLLPVIFCSCANLDHINAYAKTSSESLEQFHEIAFSFEQGCTMYSESALTAATKQTTINELPAQECSLYHNADSAIQLLHEVLLSYLQKMQKLSGSELVNYNLDNAAASFKNLQPHMKFQMTDSQVISTQNIITFLVNKAVNHYRKKALQKILLQSKHDFMQVIDAYATGITAMEADERLALISYKIFFTQPLLRSSTDDATKIMLVRDYYHKQKTLNIASKITLAHLKCIEKIRNGYDKMSANDVSISTLKNELTNTINDLKYLKEQILELKQNSQP